jgi:hypothetical protein
MSVELIKSLKVDGEIFNIGDIVHIVTVSGEEFTGRITDIEEKDRSLYRDTVRVHIDYSSEYTSKTAAIHIDSIKEICKWVRE